MVLECADMDFCAAVFAHEIGHMLGMHHDGYDIYETDTCNGDIYLMSSRFKNSQSLPTTFSTCSTDAMEKWWTENYQDKADKCLDDVPDFVVDWNSENGNPNSPVCGNGIVESGEDCDCDGGNCLNIDTCCNGATCKFIYVNYQCSAYWHPDCCDPNTCEFRKASHVCRKAMDENCDFSEYCTGTSAICPKDRQKPSGTQCLAVSQSLIDLGPSPSSGTMTVYNDEHGRCFGGKCQSNYKTCVQFGSPLTLAPWPKEDGSMDETRSYLEVKPGLNEICNLYNDECSDLYCTLSWHSYVKGYDGTWAVLEQNRCYARMMGLTLSNQAQQVLPGTPCRLPHDNNSTRTGQCWFSKCLSSEQLIAESGAGFCGDGHVGPGEECDCGSENLMSPVANCCSCSSCKLLSNNKNAGKSVCANGDCCDTQTCQYKVKGSVCGQNSNGNGGQNDFLNAMNVNASLHVCDALERCNGASPYCPPDSGMEWTMRCDAESANPVVLGDGEKTTSTTPAPSGGSNGKSGNATKGDSQPTPQVSMLLPPAVSWSAASYQYGNCYRKSCVPSLDKQCQFMTWSIRRAFSSDFVPFTSVGGKGWEDNLEKVRFSRMGVLENDLVNKDNQHFCEALRCEYPGDLYPHEKSNFITDEGRVNYGASGKMYVQDTDLYKTQAWPMQKFLFLGRRFHIGDRAFVVKEPKYVSRYIQPIQEGTFLQDISTGFETDDAGVVTKNPLKDKVFKRGPSRGKYRCADNNSGVGPKDKVRSGSDFGVSQAYSALGEAYDFKAENFPTFKQDKSGRLDVSQMQFPGASVGNTEYGKSICDLTGSNGVVSLTGHYYEASIGLCVPCYIGCSSCTGPAVWQCVKVNTQSSGILGAGQDPWQQQSDKSVYRASDIKRGGGGPDANPILLLTKSQDQEVFYVNPYTTDYLDDKNNHPEYIMNKNKDQMINNEEQSLAEQVGVPVMIAGGSALFFIICLAAYLIRRGSRRNYRAMQKARRHGRRFKTEVDRRVSGLSSSVKRKVTSSGEQSLRSQEKLAEELAAIKRQEQREREEEEDLWGSALHNNHERLAQEEARRYNSDEDNEEWDKWNASSWAPSWNYSPKSMQASGKTGGFGNMLKSSNLLTMSSKLNLQMSAKNSNLTRSKNIMGPNSPSDLGSKSGDSQAKYVKSAKTAAERKKERALMKTQEKEVNNAIAASNARLQVWGKDGKANKAAANNYYGVGNSNILNSGTTGGGGGGYKSGGSGPTNTTSQEEDDDISWKKDNKHTRDTYQDGGSGTGNNWWNKDWNSSKGGGNTNNQWNNGGNWSNDKWNSSDSNWNANNNWGAAGNWGGDWSHDNYARPSAALAMSHPREVEDPPLSPTADPSSSPRASTLMRQRGRSTNLTQSSGDAGLLRVLDSQDPDMSEEENLMPSPTNVPSVPSISPDSRSLHSVVISPSIPSVIAKEGSLNKENSTAKSALSSGGKFKSQKSLKASPKKSLKLLAESSATASASKSIVNEDDVSILIPPSPRSNLKSSVASKTPKSQQKLVFRATVESEDIDILDGGLDGPPDAFRDPTVSIESSPSIRSFKSTGSKGSKGSKGKSITKGVTRTLTGDKSFKSKKSTASVKERDGDNDSKDSEYGQDESLNVSKQTNTSPVKKSFKKGKSTVSVHSVAEGGRRSVTLSEYGGGGKKSLALSEYSTAGKKSLAASEVSNKKSIAASEVSKKSIAASEVSKTSIAASEVSKKSIAASEVSKKSIAASEASKKSLAVSEVSKKSLAASEISDSPSRAKTVTLPKRGTQKKTVGRGKTAGGEDWPERDV